MVEFYWNTSEGKSLRTQFSNTSNKRYYKEKVNNIFKEKFSEINRWGFCETTKENGILTLKSTWDDLNRINTNKYTLCYFISEVNKFDKSLTNFTDPTKYKENIDVVFEYIFIQNFNKYFVNNTTTEYKIVKQILDDNWIQGCYTNIISVLSILKYRNDIREINYGFNTGDFNDMVNGIDIEVISTNGETTKYQVKTGGFNDKNYGGVYYLNYFGGSLSEYQNVDEFIITQYNEYNNINQIECIVFDNYTEYIDKGKRKYKISERSIKYKFIGNMGIPDILHDIIKISKEKFLKVLIQNDENDNYVKISNIENDNLEIEKCIIINFNHNGDLDKLEKELKETYEKLKTS